MQGEIYTVYIEEGMMVGLNAMLEKIRWTYTGMYIDAVCSGFNTLVSRLINSSLQVQSCDTYMRYIYLYI